VVAEYSDENATAYKGNRGPGLERAMGECERLVAESHDVALVVQHSDRLARGDVKQARHLVEYVVWAIKHGVALRSVQDPEMFAEGDMAVVLAGIGGMRNNQDSKRSPGGQRRAPATGSGSWQDQR
jgi:hypothetical protein